MPTDLHITLCQSAIAPDDPAANRANFNALLSTLGGADLVVLPEVFTTGFHPRARQHAEAPGGPSWQWLAQQAAHLDAVVTASLVTQQGDDYVNRLVWARPDGTFGHYDKRHLFRMAGEHERYRAGTERPIFHHRGWRILPQVCYDLRFPVFSRNRDDYDLALYVANWPAARHDHWLALLKARAIENLSYVVGVNRVGRDVYAQEYAGGSVVFSPRGELLLDGKDQTGCYSTRLSRTELEHYRRDFPAFLDSDSFTLEGFSPD